jgi:SSS family solute:Na+ symporter
MVLNYTFLGLFLLFTYLIGKYASQRVNNVSDFIVGSGTLGPFAIICTQVATWFGAGCLIGHIGSAYRNGITILASIMCVGLGALFTNILFAKWLRQQKWKTLADWTCNIYGESKYMRVMVSLLHLVLYSSWTVAQVTGCGFMVSNLLGVQYWVGVVLFSVIIILLTTSGGMIGVAWMDSFHQIVITIGWVVLIFFAFRQTNGFKVAFDVGREYFNFSKPSTLWFISTALGTTCASIFAQTAIQRIWASKDLKTAQIGLSCSFVVSVIISFLVMIVGLSVRGLGANLETPDDSVFWLIAAMPKWVEPLYIIAILGAAFSTADSALNATASNIANDVYHNVINTEADDNAVLRVAKLATVIIGVCCMLLSLRPITMISYMFKVGYAIVTGGLFFPLMLGMYWKRASRKAAMISMASGTIGAVIFEFVPSLNMVLGGGTLPGVILGGVTMVVGSFIFSDACGDAIHR